MPRDRSARRSAAILKIAVFLPRATSYHYVIGLGESLARRRDRLGIGRGDRRIERPAFRHVKAPRLSVPAA